MCLHTSANPDLVATTDIEAEKDLFEIPRSIVLSVENSDLHRKLPEALSDLDSWLSLVVVMIYEYLERPDTFWRPYFRVLPDHFDTLIFWSPAELAELQGSAVTQKIGKQVADRMFCERVVPIVRNNPQMFPYPQGVESYEGPSGQEVILAMAHTMATLVMAYGFDIEKDESMQQVDDEGFMSDDDEDNLPKGMVPLADMLNADAEGNNVCSVVRCQLNIPTYYISGSTVLWGEFSRDEVVSPYQEGRANLQRLWTAATFGSAPALWLHHRQICLLRRC